MDKTVEREVHYVNRVRDTVQICSGSSMQYNYGYNTYTLHVRAHTHTVLILQTVNYTCVQFIIPDLMILHIQILNLAINRGCLELSHVHSNTSIKLSEFLFITRAEETCSGL